MANQEPESAAEVLRWIFVYTVTAALFVAAGFLLGRSSLP